jgi:hypothetical protein
MQNKYFKYLLIILVVVFIIPQIALAAWWNPTTWNWNIFDWFSKPQTATVQPKQSINRNQVQNVTTQTSTDQTAGWKTYTNTDYGFEFQYPLTVNVALENYTPTHGTNLVLPNSNFLEKTGLVGNILSFGIFQKATSNLENFVSNEINSANKVNAKYNEPLSAYQKININGAEAFEEDMGQIRRIYIENPAHVLFFQYTGSDTTAQQIVSTFKFTN